MPFFFGFLPSSRCDLYADKTVCTAPKDVYIKLNVFISSKRQYFFFFCILSGRLPPISDKQHLGIIKEIFAFNIIRELFYYTQWDLQV